MKNILLFGFTFASFFCINGQSNCNDAFSAANYSVAHSTKAYESYNATHVQEWTSKAMETFREVEDLTSDCGCDEVSNFAYEGYEASEKSQYQNTWEQSRFYAKRAKQKATLMIEALAECTNTDVFNIQNASFEEKDYASSDNDLQDYYDNESSIDTEKEELLAQQKLLAQQQAELELKINKQKKAEEALKKERELLYKEHVSIKDSADKALVEINVGFQNLANALGCKAAFEMAKNSFELTKQQIDEAAIDNTKLHYTLKLNEIAEKAMLNFSDCSISF